MISTSNLIYFENNRSTVIDWKIAEEMSLFVSKSVFERKNHNQTVINSAISQIATLINCSSNELAFTNGTSNSIALGIELLYAARKPETNHIITSHTEHPAVLNACKKLEENGAILSFVGVDQLGLLDMDELAELIKPQTALVCLMAANNETGVISPIEKIVALCKKKEVLFFCDASQFVGKEYCDIQELGIDCMAFGSHKMYGPKGIGALYLNESIAIKNVSLKHQFTELQLSGNLLSTELIVGFGKACEIAKRDYWEISAQVSKLRNYFEHQLLDIEGLRINGSTRYRIYNTSNLFFPEALKILNLKTRYEFLSNQDRISKTLLAMGLSEQESRNSFRFSFGKYNTLEEVKKITSEILQLHNISIK